MQICVSVGGAVCRDQKFCAIEKRRFYRDQFDLYRPLPQSGYRTPGHDRRWLRPVVQPCVQFPHPGTGTAVLLLNAFTSLLLYSFRRLYRRFVIGRGLPFLECNRICGTLRETVSESVAKVLTHQFRLAVHHINGSFMARTGTRAAAAAFFLVDMDDFPNHNRFPLVCSTGSYYNRAYQSVVITTFLKNGGEKFGNSHACPLHALP